VRRLFVFSLFVVAVLRSQIPVIKFPHGAEFGPGFGSGSVLDPVPDPHYLSKIGRILRKKFNILTFLMIYYLRYLTKMSR
jgi:hypothetical protein